jgi:hypothetical protein
MDRDKNFLLRKINTMVAIGIVTLVALLSATALNFIIKKSEDVFFPVVLTQSM